MVRAPESGRSAEGGSVASGPVTSGSASGSMSEVPPPPQSWLMPPQRVSSAHLPTYDWHMYGDLGSNWDSRSWGACPESLSSSRGLSPCRKRLGRCCNWAWVLLVLGKLIIVTAGLLSGMYFSIRAITTSLEHVETIPTYANAILLVCLGIVFVFLYKRQDPIMLATGLVLCVVCTVLCMASAVLLGVRAIRTMDEFAYCRYNDGKHQCHCFMAARPTQAVMEADASEGWNLEYIYAGAINCELIEQNLHDYICVLCAGYVMAVVLCNATTVVAVVYFRQERQKAGLLQYEADPDIMLPGDLPPGPSGFHFSTAASTEMPPPPPPPAPPSASSQIFSRHITLPGLGTGRGAARLLSQQLCLPGDDHARLLQRQASNASRDQPEQPANSCGLPGGNPDSVDASTSGQAELVGENGEPVEMGSESSIQTDQRTDGNNASTDPARIEIPGPGSGDPIPQVPETTGPDSPDPSAVWRRNPNRSPAHTNINNPIQEPNRTQCHMQPRQRGPVCGVRGCEMDMFMNPPPGMIANWVRRADPIEIGPVSRSRSRRRREMARRNPFFQHTNLPCCAGGSSSGRSSRSSSAAGSRPLSQHLAFHYWMSGFAGFWPPVSPNGGVYPYPVEPPPPYCPHQLPPYMEHDPVPEYRSRATTPVAGSIRSDSSSSSIHVIQQGGSTSSIHAIQQGGSTSSVPEILPEGSTTSIPEIPQEAPTNSLQEMSEGTSISSVQEMPPEGCTNSEVTLPPGGLGCLEEPHGTGQSVCSPLGQAADPSNGDNLQARDQLQAKLLLPAVTRKQGDVIETTV